ncbi:MAG TPA: hypothetical protein VKD90_14800 [Gemmataceae bacterium]|nr:hypothetical protein [Gemmataceae bacterium]
MTRGLTLACLALGLLIPAEAVAQTRERVKVTGLRLGLPIGPVRSDMSRTGIFKPGQWAPVYVDLECSRDTGEPLQLIVETRDADEVITEGSVEIAAMVKGDRLQGNELGRLPYLKPGQVNATLTVRVKGAKSGRTYGESSERYMQSVEGPAFVILGIGANLNSIRFPTGTTEPDEAASGVRELRGGWVETAQIVDVGHLPDQWFGYAAVDLMVLGTGANREFWETLAAPAHEKRRKAIAEWVRRGGRVVVSVGTNPDVLEANKEIRDILPATIPPGGKRSANKLELTWQVTGTITGRNATIAYPDQRTDFAVATLQPRPDRPTKVVVTEGESKTPLAVQGPHGLGRVTILAFDLDRAPFTDWRAGRAPFWENLVNQAGFMLPGRDQKMDKYGSRFDEYTGALQGSLDYFEGVPVVSFGWVALFILIYIVLIGPLDYLFLKKVVKRLEWTWVTFPVIVITVSAGAYFAAYALKGKDLKINKVDVVDIDLIGKRVDGNAWFTLFSPRIQNYTIGIEPAGAPSSGTSEPAWTAGDPSVTARDSLLGWQSNVERNRYGGGGGGGLFSKRYKYQSSVDPDDPNHDLYASGLEGVPIQVWTTKAFSALWTAPIDPAKPPITADLTQQTDKVLVGTITNNLPTDQFTDRALFWRGKVYELPDFPVGVTKFVSFAAEPGTQEVKDWLNKASAGYVPMRQQNYYPTSGEAGTTTNPNFRLWPVLFADVSMDVNRQYAPNASLRKLDQSWRVAADRPEQAVLVLRLPTRDGVKEMKTAEDMTRDPASPSRLWLGELPTGNKPRPAVQGTLKQETYIRVFIPVETAPKK